MSLTPLAAALKLPTAEYCGAETPARFSEVSKELAALNEGVAVHDMGWTAFIKVTGEDRVRWLNGMVTNNTRDLAAGHGNYNFVLTTQGRISADMNAYNMGDHYMLATSMAQRAHLLEVLNKFIIMDDVELTDITDGMSVLGVVGPKAAELLAAMKLPTPKEEFALQPAELNGVKLAVVMTSASPLTFHIGVEPKDVQTVWQAFIAAGATPAGSEAVEIHRVLNGIPLYGRDIREKELPQETGQERALHFTKGCYVGQEIVERIRSRGIVHRLFTGFTLDRIPAATNPSENIKLMQDGKDVGYITSTARVPTAAGERAIALGYIRREASAPGTAISAGDASGQVASLPFKL